MTSHDAPATEPQAICTACGHQPQQIGAGACARCEAPRLAPMVSAGPIQAGRVLEQRYVLLGSLGDGGMGAVYRAADLRFDRVVALKLLRGEWASNTRARRRFEREARNSAKLSHHHNIKVFDYGYTDDGHAYLVMELVKGAPLAHLTLPLPASRAVAIAEQIASALAEAHDLELVHRDLKPANIMVSRDAGRDFVRVLDYGIAKALDTQTELTQHGKFIGTADYAAPEQAEGREDIDARADVYALGCVLYELLTGEPPFVRERLGDTLRAHLLATPDPPSARAPMSPGCEALVLRCLEKSPDARFSSMGELRRALMALPEWRVTDPRTGAPDTVNESDTGPLTPPVPPTRIDVRSDGEGGPGHGSPHRAWLGMGAALALGVGITLVAVGVMSGGESEPEASAEVAPAADVGGETGAEAPANPPAVVPVRGRTGDGSSDPSDVGVDPGSNTRSATRVVLPDVQEREVPAVRPPSQRAPEPSPPLLALGRPCDVPSVCASGFCGNGRCAPEGFSYIPSGTFTMGSPSGEVGRRSNETQHSVTLSRAFFLQQTEVTQGQWRTLMGNNPSRFTSCGDDCPVESVNWYEALAYANALSAAEGLAPCYVLSGCSNTAGNDMECSDVSATAPGGNPLLCDGYRLPTESEWEYAARAGTTTATYLGDLQSPYLCDPQPHLEPIAWYCENAGSTTHPVATLASNGWGVHDMLGNVLEWCWDWYGTYPGRVTDPLGATSRSGSSRVLRGGSWLYGALFARAASRNGNSPGFRSNGIGFRLARTAP